MLNTAKKILKKLIDSGYVAYIVGGYVRDSLLGLESYDIDITTSAKPEEIASIFDTIDNGIKYGSITINFEGKSFEITTFRLELSYEDNRHPGIKFTQKLSDDLKRRDYTINALCMDYSGKIIDEYQGVSDLKNKTIRCIGEAILRFNEDSLRILRGLYLVSKLDFDIDSNTLEAMKKSSNLLFNISKAKCTKEMTKIIRYNKNNKVFEYMQYLNIFNLKEECRYLLDNNIIISDPILFYAYLVYSDKASFIELDKESNKKLKKIKELSNNKISKYDIIEYDIDLLNYANELRKVLKKEYIKDFYEYINELPIKKYDDIDISSEEILNITKKNKGSWLKELKKDIAYLIIDKKIENDKEEIIKYILKVVK